MKYQVKHYVSANFGTLSGWSVKEYETLEEAKEAAGKWGLIIDLSNGADITNQVKGAER